ncbi:MAG TPA: DUF6491 family protein [Steroidobacteraceae bacterium]|nr:DUF6491 family protein [Steroidobacteraceae bacterium]
MIPNAKSGRTPVRHLGVIDLLRASRLLFIGALLLMSTRALAATPQCEIHAAKDHETLLAWRLANWEPLDDRTVLIWTEHSSRASLVKLGRPLDGLTSADIISLVDRDGDGKISACGRDAMTIGYDESDAVQIVSIRLLSERRTVALDEGEELSRLVLSRV